MLTEGPDVLVEGLITEAQNGSLSPALIFSSSNVDKEKESQSLRTFKDWVSITVEGNLKFFCFFNGKPYTTFDQTAFTIIKDFIKELVDTLNEEDKEVIKSFQTLSQTIALAERIAGKMIKDENCNAISGNGINPTGLTKLIYEASSAWRTNVFSAFMPRLPTSYSTLRPITPMLYLTKEMLVAQKQPMQSFITQEFSKYAREYLIANLRSTGLNLTKRRRDEEVTPITDDNKTSEEYKAKKRAKA